MPTYAETLIEAANALQGERGLSDTAKRALRFCCADVEKARAGLADQKNQLVMVVTAIERVLETGKRLTGHEHNDERYSKVTTLCAALGLREKLDVLEKQIASANTEIENWRAIWANVRPEIKERVA